MNLKQERRSYDVAHLIGMWAQTIGSMNSTSNCLIIYWKNTFLRTERMKVIEDVKIYGREVEL